MTTLRLIADDLTGALDSAAQFTARLGPLPVWLRPDRRADPSGSFAIDLACRDGGADAAIAGTLQVAALLSAGEIAFKKIDSLLRGHWAAELAALARTDAFARIILAPAFPAQGRHTSGGRQYVMDPAGHLQPVPVDPAAALAAFGISVSLCPDAVILEAPVPESGRVMLCDAASDEALAAIAASGQRLPGRTLWCGTAGLAAALSGLPPSRSFPRPGGTLVLVGTDHPVTKAQIARVAQSGPHRVQVFDHGSEASARRIAEALSRHGCCLCLPDLPPGSDRPAAATTIAHWLGGVLPRLPRPDTLVVVGGQTLASVCRVLALDMLLVEGEWRPGIPASSLTAGRWAGTRCFSKSGAFGDAACLDDLILAATEAPAV